MTDDELAAVRGWYANERARWKRAQGNRVTVMPAYPWVRYFEALLAEVERLRTREEDDDVETSDGRQALLV